ncbi:metal-dependent hydrolase [Cohnella sp.]|uniref:metal-dependent hydrolase n=1 Tax=Cohnella sp. TaxID=1883426 RepID=UPI003563F592
MTHTLFGFAIYGALNKIKMDNKTKLAFLAASVGSSVIPDIDLQWASSSAKYLMSHRGITHSFFMVPVWAALFYVLSYIIFRVKDRRIFTTAFAGVLLHIISDWTNAWGTGLLEPFTSRRYSIGVIPNEGHIFWAIAIVVALLLLLFRRKEYRLRIFRTFWFLSAIYASFQIAFSAYIYFELKAEGYKQVSFRADRYPGGLTYFALNDNVVVEGGYELGGEREVTQNYPIDHVDLEELKENRSARDIILFAPFVVTQDLGDHIRLFDPRFSGRIAMLDIQIPKVN